MIRTGLVSVTFRGLSPREVIDITCRAGLEGIEWGGDIHVPHGDIKTAENVSRMTRERGLEIPSYGSYYKVGNSEQAGLSFARVLETAQALKTRSIRVWAGSRGSKEADAAYRQTVRDDARRIAAMAEKAGLRISFEYHSGSLTDTWASAYELLERIDRENVGIYWQPIYGMAAEDNVKGLVKLLPFMTNIHVFHWWPTSRDRHLLSEGVSDWRMYMSKIKAAGGSRFAMIEFVKDDNPDNLLSDAETLRSLLR